MITVRITPTIADEYATRSVYDFIGAQGTYQITREQAEELLDDALHQALHTDCTPQGAVRAYSALATNLLASLG